MKFYPAYVEKKNRKISVAAPVEYDPDRSVKDQRSEICEALRDSIERKACEMKKHKPVPFLPPRWYGAYGEFEDGTNPPYTVYSPSLALQRGTGRRCVPAFLYQLTGKDSSSSARLAVSSTVRSKNTPRSSVSRTIAVQVTVLASRSTEIRAS